jgi:hypothetical protein
MRKTKTFADPAVKTERPPSAGPVRKAPALEGGPGRVKRGGTPGSRRVGRLRADEAGAGADSAEVTLRGFGNRRAGARSGVQGKLAISAPGDREEQEADQVAATVVAGRRVARIGSLGIGGAGIGPSPAPRQPQAGPSGVPGSGSSPGGCCGRRGTVAASRIDVDRSSAPGRAPAALEDARIEGGLKAPSAGRPLTESIRSEMESRIGRDFSDVRVHDTQGDRETAAGVGAKAFTYRNHIWMGPGASAGDRGLMAHELTHVVQQGASGGQALPARASLVRGDVPTVARQPGPRSRTGSRGQGQRLLEIRFDQTPARIDTSKGIDEITRDFYSIPIPLIPPGTSIPAGPLLTLGRYGCGLRRYGLTVDDFSLTYRLRERDMQHSAHPFMSGSGLQTVECWSNHVEVTARLRNTIYLPNDLATHPCLTGQDARQFRAETLAHEQGHESDNTRAAEETLRELRGRLAFTFGVGRLMARIAITSDPEGFAADSFQALDETLERLRGEYEVVYARKSAEYAAQRDPHDREFLTIKLHLLEQARARGLGSR